MADGVDESDFVCWTQCRHRTNCRGSHQFTLVENQAADDAADQVAHNGTYALAEHRQGTAHIAGYALPDWLACSGRAD